MSDLPVLQYLDLPGTFHQPLSSRGGAVRFFLLYHDIPFAEDLITFETWNGGLKAEVVASGLNPGGTLPFVTLPNGFQVTEHLSVLRFLARLNNVGSKDGAEGDAVQDIIADTYPPARAAWVKVVFEPTPEGKVSHKLPE
eukprot:c10585_g1_i1.p1 GENE.c10585_g1_i1~~c10585_g1_i1.p1  ORF type:complete len:150 (-),score=31.79 c10585_g1_i1:524-943(-)